MGRAARLEHYSVLILSFSGPRFECESRTLWLDHQSVMERDSLWLVLLQLQPEWSVLPRQPSLGASSSTEY